MRRLAPMLPLIALAVLALAPAAHGAGFGVAKPTWKSPNIITVATAPAAGGFSQNGAISNSEGRTIQVCITSADVTAAGPVTLTCTVDKSTLKTLRKRSARITLTTIFVAADGSSEFKTQKITLPRAR